MRRPTPIGSAAAPRTRLRSAATMTGLAAAAFAVLHRLGRTWGSTRRERGTRMPGDEIVRKPFGATMHAVSIDAPPERVWPWLVQMGYHRGGWYTYPWVDRWIWHIYNASADRVIDELQNLRVGDIVPDGEPGTAYYVVEHLEPARSLVLHSTTHVFPPALRDRVRLSWTWSFLLEPVAGGTATRLLLRVRAEGSAPVAAAFHALIVPSDFVMARSMLLGIKRRAEDAERGRPWPPGMSGPRRSAATAAPAVVAAAMAVIFPAAARRYGPIRGYRYAFGLYWATCFIVTVAVLGPRGIRQSLTHPTGNLPRPRALAVATLAVPVVGAVAVELRPHLREVSGTAVAVAPIIGTVNAVAEELLWRALPAAAHPGDPVRGWLWPAAAFTAWHLAPLAVQSHGRARLLAGAALIGVGYGWIAWNTGSVAATLLPHAATDSCGIRAAQAIWVLGSTDPANAEVRRQY
jgi:membrane protease YdiL (CAAX protease family)